jgi:hypothetical protein
LKIRTFLFALIVLAACTLNTVFDTVVHPTVSAQLAVQQLDDTEASAISMRSYDRLASSLPVLSWAIVGLSGLALFAKPLYNLTSEKS